MENKYDFFFNRMKRDRILSRKGAQEWGRQEFKEFLAQSPTKEIFIDENGEEFETSFQSGSFRDDRDLRYLVLPYDVEFPLGEVFTRKENGEKWICFRHEPHQLEIDNRYVVYNLPNILSWVDEFGVRRDVECLIVGSMTNKIRENFRTWNAVITPQPSRTLEVIMPTYKIPRDTRILQGDEAWYLVDFDNVSKEGVSFLTLSETKLNPYVDDVEKKLANINKLNSYKIIVRNTPITIKPSVPSKLNVWVEKNGNKVNEELVIVSNNKQLKYENGNLISDFAGQYSVTASLKRSPSVTKRIPVVASAVQNISTVAIEGDSHIRWGEGKIYGIYEYENTNKVPLNLPIEVIDPQNLVKVVELPEGVRLKALGGEVGEVILRSTYKGEVYEKTIQIKSIWR